MTSFDLGYEMALKNPEWPELATWDDAAFTMVAGVAFAHTPKHVREIISVVDASAPFHMSGLDPAGLAWDQQGQSTVTGGPTRFTVVGKVGINAILAAGATLEVLSSGTDTRTGTIRGKRSGEYVTATFTLTGTSAVSISQAFDDVLQFFVATSNSSNTVTLRLAGAGATVSTIGPDEVDAEYWRLRLNFVPASADTVRLIYKASPPAVTGDSHQYLLPISNFLYHFAIGMYFEKRRLGPLAAHHFQLAEADLLKTLMELKGQTQDVAIPYRRLLRPLGIVVYPLLLIGLGLWSLMI